MSYVISAVLYSFCSVLKSILISRHFNITHNFWQHPPGRKQNEELDVEKEVQVMEQEREQLRLADEMAILARSLKDNAALAGRIVREDNEVVFVFLIS